GLHRLDGDLGMPVIGRGDQDTVDVLVVQDFAVFHCAAGRVAADDLDRPVEAAAVDIADFLDHDVVAVFAVRDAPRVPPTLAADADHAEAQAVVGAADAGPAGRGHEVGRAGRGRDALDEPPPGKSAVHGGLLGINP